MSPYYLVDIKILEYVQKKDEKIIEGAMNFLFDTFKHLNLHFQEDLSLWRYITDVYKCTKSLWLRGYQLIFNTKRARWDT